MRKYFNAVIILLREVVILCTASCGTRDSVLSHIILTFFVFFLKKRESLLPYTSVGDLL